MEELELATSHTGAEHDNARLPMDVKRKSALVGTGSRSMIADSEDDA